jgi:hypothetical protein
LLFVILFNCIHFSYRPGAWDRFVVGIFGLEQGIVFIGRELVENAVILGTSVIFDKHVLQVVDELTFAICVDIR